MPDDEKRSDDAPQPIEARADAIAEADVVTEALADRPTVQSAPARRRGGAGIFLGAVLGGVLAAAAGFGLARIIPGGWPVQDLSALEAKITAQSDQLAALAAEMAQLSARPVADAAQDIAALRAEVEDRLAQAAVAVDPAPAVAEATDDLKAALAALDSRLTEIEKRPAGTGSAAPAAALAAYERDLQALRDQVAAQSGRDSDVAAQIEAIAAEAKAQLAAAGQEAERLKSEAAAAAQSVATGAALGRIRAALEGGGPYQEAVADLTSFGIAVPEDLSALSGSGVPTLTDLQRSFPPAARDALTAALRSQTPTGWGDRLSAFLRTQTGARSLEPRDGTDPDAILSRAEARLADGDVAGALAELSALPDPAKTVLAPWIETAEARQRAIAALGDLSAAADSE